MSASKNVTCSDCGKKFAIENGISERLVPDTAATVEVGMKCPHCKGWTHSYYLNTPLRNTMALVEKRRREAEAGKPGAFQRYRKARKRFQEQFDRTNAFLRAKHGGQSPTDRGQSPSARLKEPSSPDSA